MAAMRRAVAGSAAEAHVVPLLAVVCTNVASLGFARTAVSDALPFRIDDGRSVTTIPAPGCLPSLEPRVSASCRRFA